MEKDERTLAELARNANQCQDACNLSGVVHSFSRDIRRLRELLPGAGTDQINRHPVSVLYASKIESLTGCDNTSVLSNAMDECNRLAGQ